MHTSFALFQSGFDGGGDGAAGFVGDERDGFVRFDREAGFDGVFGARHQLGLRRAEGRNHIFILAQLDCNLRWDVCTGTSFYTGRTLGLRSPSGELRVMKEVESNCFKNACLGFSGRSAEPVNTWKILTECVVQVILSFN